MEKLKRYFSQGSGSGLNRRRIVLAIVIGFSVLVLILVVIFVVFPLIGPKKTLPDPPAPLILELPPEE